MQKIIAIGKASSLKILQVYINDIHYTLSCRLYRWFTSMTMTHFQAQHSRHSSPVGICQDCRHSTWPGSGHWQWLNDVWPRHCRLSFGLLPAASVTNDCAFAVRYLRRFSSFRLRRIVTFHHTMHFSAKRGLAIACRLYVLLSVGDVGGLWSHRLEFFENNFTVS